MTNTGTHTHNLTEIADRHTALGYSADAPVVTMGCECGYWCVSRIEAAHLIAAEHRAVPTAHLNPANIIG